MGFTYIKASCSHKNDKDIIINTNAALNDWAL